MSNDREIVSLSYLYHRFGRKRVRESFHFPFTSFVVSLKDSQRVYVPFTDLFGVQRLLRIK